MLTLANKTNSAIESIEYHLNNGSIIEFKPKSGLNWFCKHKDETKYPILNYDQVILHFLSARVNQRLVKLKDGLGIDRYVPVMKGQTIVSGGIIRV